MKKFVSLAVILLFIGSIATAAGAKKEKDKYKEWLDEEVKLLITSEEEAEFNKLKTDEEKDAFIDLFWAKRDPSPTTKENEFKDEWYTRLEHVNKTFTRGVSKSWRSDQGKVYMFFGPPSSTSATGPVDRGVSTGGTQISGGTEVWVYQPMPALGLNEAFRVTFHEYQYGFELDGATPPLIRQALEKFPQVVLFNPDLKELPRYRITLDPTSYEGKLINDFIISGTEVKQIGMEWTPIYTRAMGGSTYISLLARIDPGEIDRKKLKEVTFFGRIRGESGESEDFMETVNIEKEKQDKPLALVGFPAYPGKSVIYLGVRDKGKENYTLIKSELDVPDYWKDELSVSSLILSSEVKSLSKGEDIEEEFNPYVTSQYKAAPRWGNIFKASDSLNALYQIYNAKLENESLDLLVEYFIISEEVGYRLNPQEIKQKMEPDKALASGTQVPLSPLKPGQYTFKIKITDRIASKVVEASAVFMVE